MSDARKTDLFEGAGPVRRKMPLLLPEDSQLRDPALYVADPGLRQAVNVAMLLGKPLLVTGEPGTGKTQLAQRIAYELSENNPPEQPLIFHTKTTSTATDLFYTYDSLRHFQDIQFDRRADSAWDYVRWQALGIAIIRAEARDAARALLPAKYHRPEPCRSVVLIDEVDKAPRDLPNDILNEIENLEFYMKELTSELDKVGIVQPFRATPEYSPIVILTSNSERDLPDAFLRRCIFYYISFPSASQLLQIIQKRVKLTFFNVETLEHAITRFEQFRNSAHKKKPSTEELLAWVRILDGLGIDPMNPKPEQEKALEASYSTLAKSREDLVWPRGSLK